MSKLVYGKNGQVRFLNEAEKQEAFQYMLTSNNVDIFVHEDNQEQGAWASEERIHFYREAGVPECLKRNMTAGNEVGPHDAAAQGQGDLGAEHGARQVEDRRHADCRARGKHFCGDNCRNRVCGVVKAVDKIKDNGKRYDNNEQRH